MLRSSVSFVTRVVTLCAPVVVSSPTSGSAAPPGAALSSSSFASAAGSCTPAAVVLAAFASASSAASSETADCSVARHEDHDSVTGTRAMSDDILACQRCTTVPYEHGSDSGTS